jgi:hypothetical protein
MDKSKFLVCFLIFGSGPKIFGDDKEVKKNPKKKKDSLTKLYPA